MGCYGGYSPSLGRISAASFMILKAVLILIARMEITYEKVTGVPGEGTLEGKVEGMRARALELGLSP